MIQLHDDRKYNTANKSYLAYTAGGKMRICASAVFIDKSDSLNLLFLHYWFSHQDFICFYHSIYLCLVPTGFAYGYYHDVYISFNISVFSERELTFTFAICYRPSVCRLSVTFVRPTQAAQIFGNISTALGNLAIRGHPLKILRRSSQGNPSAGGVEHKRGSKI